MRSVRGGDRLEVGVKSPISCQLRCGKQLAARLRVLWRFCMNWHISVFASACMPGSVGGLRVEGKAWRRGSRE
ncbi:hypothetical protein CBR_g46757 [Chara braunii]|uniref:Uncharacterized protein n=1 Tax=Chara braunii TaxID=69332 RepID=A0A388K434_CHABU|nr:hypothetical protein CBR_g46757 [Chara braunii]|eukprot:GBG64801.1 hypothetical protein CBR_g46757 [Chara braunii]